jgi:dimethylargininase
MKFTSALARPPGSSFAQGLTMSVALGRPDLALARAQHTAYCAALSACGVGLSLLEPDDRFPDSTFVEDTAVIAARVTVVTRPGADSRRGETAAIEAALGGARAPLAHIVAPGTVDGGDVCQVGEHFLIGVSARTNESGAAQLAAILRQHGYTAETVDIRTHHALLHLKSGISWLGDGRCLAVPGFPRVEGLPRLEWLVTAAAEDYAANCVRVNDTLLFAAGYPGTEALLRGLGYRLCVLDTSEFRKMDGGLSCLSLRLP